MGNSINPRKTPLQVPYSATGYKGDLLQLDPHDTPQITAAPQPDHRDEPISLGSGQNNTLRLI